MNVKLSLTRLSSIDITKAVALYLATNGVKYNSIVLGVDEVGVYATVNGLENMSIPQSVITNIDKHIDSVVNEKVLEMLVTGRITVGQIEMVRHKLRNEAFADVSL